MPKPFEGTGVEIPVDPWLPDPPGGGVLEEPVGLLHLEGPDTLRFLHGQTSQALEGAPPGAWRSTCCLTPTARMRALAEVLVEGGGAWLVITAGDGAAVRQALDRVLFPADRVSLGPLVPARLLTALSEAGEDSRPPAVRDPAVPHQGPLLADSTGTWQALEEGPGWRFGPCHLLPEGAKDPAALVGRPRLTALQRERRRIRLGIPAVPGEIQEGTNPFELGLAARVSLAKGCYAGQETLARLATYDGVKQQLRRWQAPAGSAPPPPGTVLVDAEGGRCGTITSTLALPEGNGSIGLALVRRQALELDSLRAGEGPEAMAVLLSLPQGFSAPPVGTGGGGGSAGVSS